MIRASQIFYGKWPAEGRFSVTKLGNLDRIRHNQDLAEGGFSVTKDLVDPLYDALNFRPDSYVLNNGGKCGKLLGIIIMITMKMYSEFALF